MTKGSSLFYLVR